MAKVVDWSSGVKVIRDHTEIIPSSKTDLLKYAADRRYSKEIGGIITIGGMFVATDDRSKVLLQSVRTAAEANPDHVEGWKTASGEWIDLDAATIIGISNAVCEHISGCFALERSIAAEIEAGTVTSLAEVEAAFA